MVKHSQMTDQEHKDIGNPAFQKAAADLTKPRPPAIEAPTAMTLARRSGDALDIPAFEPASLARTNADIPAEFMNLGELPWEHYWMIEKDAIFRGVLVALIKRYEEDDDAEQNDGEEGAVYKIRRTFVARCTAPTKCSRKIKPDDTREILGEIVEKNSDNKHPDKFDVYVVPEGTLVAFDYRKMISDFAPMAMGKYAFEVFLKAGGRVPVKDAKKAAKGHRYWELLPGARSLAPRERDTSIDYLNEKADVQMRLMKEGNEGVPF